MVLIVAVILVMSVFIIQNDRQDSITGNAVTNTQVSIIPVPFSNCSFDLHSGWNLVSFYCLGLFSDRNTVLNSIDGNYTMIFTYDASDANDPWKSYNPSLPDWTVQQLSNMNRFSGYWIYISNDVEYFYPGVNASSNIPLYNGWNLVGYPTTTGRPVNESLHDVSFSILETYDNPADTWLQYVNGSSNNTFSTMSTYKGYWINVSSAQAWLVNKT
jgi:hypothetical protein